MSFQQEKITKTMGIQVIDIIGSGLLLLLLLLLMNTPVQVQGDMHRVIIISDGL